MCKMYNRLQPRSWCSLQNWGNLEWRKPLKRRLIKRGKEILRKHKYIVSSALSMWANPFLFFFSLSLTPYFTLCLTPSLTFSPTSLSFSFLLPLFLCLSPCIYLSLSIAVCVTISVCVSPPLLSRSSPPVFISPPPSSFPSLNLPPPLSFQPSIILSPNPILISPLPLSLSLSITSFSLPLSPCLYLLDIYPS